MYTFPSFMNEPPDPLDALAKSALDGDRVAMTQLAEALWPFASAAAKKSQSREALDEAHELFAELLERLEQGDMAALRSYLPWKTRHPEKRFADWVRIVVANLQRDRVRARVGRTPQGASQLPTQKRVLNELASLEPLDQVGYRPPVTNAQTAREILEFAAKHLPPLQARALSAWASGESFAELQSSMGVDSEEGAVRLVRAALATLRRQFGAT